MSKRNTPRNTTPTPKRPRRTEAQHERDNTREKSGRFSSLNPCELCGKSCGARAYTSDERCNVAGATHGLGVVLHPRCGAVLALLDDETFAAVLVAARDVRRARVGELPRASCGPTGRCRYHGAGGPASRACGGDDYAGAVRTCTDCGRESVGGAYHWPSCPQLRDDGVCPLCGGRERAGVCEGDCTNEPGLADDRQERFARAARAPRAGGAKLAAPPAARLEFVVVRGSTYPVRTIAEIGIAKREMLAVRVESARIFASPSASLDELARNDDGVDTGRVLEVHR